MTEEVLIPSGDNAGDTATLLLGAADALDLEPFVVRYQPEDNGFRVPPEVAEEAGLKAKDESKSDTEPKPAKKAPAKKTAAKKTAAKKASAPKAAAETDPSK